jgi:hypothetical protein
MINNSDVNSNIDGLQFCDPVLASFHEYNVARFI